MARTLVKNCSQISPLRNRSRFLLKVETFQIGASHKSFKPKDKGGPPTSGSNPEVDFKGKARSNDTHESTTVPQARLFQKSKNTPALLGYLVHA
jgi:hypothetical protein